MLLLLLLLLLLPRGALELNDARQQVGQRRSAVDAAAAAATAYCGKCQQKGHWTYECKNERV